MHPTTDVQHEEMIAAALAAVRAGETEMRETLDRLAAPIYTTDAEGRITYFNKACVAFAGRSPQVGRDSWCVSWKLYTNDGVFLPHDECPMAVAIKEKRPVRGASAIAERPDGSRVNFVPYPTPLLDEEGEIVGAVNMLIDVTDRRHARELRNQAMRCRRLALSVNDQRTINVLVAMADEFEQKARSLERLN